MTSFLKSRILSDLSITSFFGSLSFSLLLQYYRHLFSSRLPFTLRDKFGSGLPKTGFSSATRVLFKTYILTSWKLFCGTSLFRQNFTHILKCFVFVEKCLRYYDKNPICLKFPQIGVVFLLIVTFLVLDKTAQFFRFFFPNSFKKFKRGLVVLQIQLLFRSVYFTCNIVCFPRSFLDLNIKGLEKPSSSHNSVQRALGSSKLLWNPFITQ